MRDEMDARIWVANHNQFADGIDDLIDRLRAASARAVSWHESTTQLGALVAAFLITAVTFSTTSMT